MLGQLSQQIKRIVSNRGRFAFVFARKVGRKIAVAKKKNVNYLEDVTFLQPPHCVVSPLLSTKRLSNRPAYVRYTCRLFLGSIGWKFGRYWRGHCRIISAKCLELFWLLCPSALSFFGALPLRLIIAAPPFFFSCVCVCTGVFENGRSEVDWDRTINNSCRLSLWTLLFCSLC